MARVIPRSSYNVKRAVNDVAQLITKVAWEISCHWLQPDPQSRVLTTNDKCVCFLLEIRFVIAAQLVPERINQQKDCFLRSTSEHYCRRQE
jgi:hypothetical protein